jgi:hypothetical protein
MGNIHESSAVGTSVWAHTHTRFFLFMLFESRTLAYERGETAGLTKRALIPSHQTTNKKKKTWDDVIDSNIHAIYYVILEDREAGVRVNNDLIDSYVNICLNQTKIYSQTKTKSKKGLGYLMKWIWLHLIDNIFLYSKCLVAQLAVCVNVNSTVCFWSLLVSFSARGLACFPIGKSLQGGYGGCCRVFVFELQSFYLWNPNTAASVLRKRDKGQLPSAESSF